MLNMMKGKNAMKLSSIRIIGMHNVTDKTYDLSNLNYFYGKNGAGKSTVLQAVQLALLGYIPGTDKKKSAIFSHANSSTMSVVLTIADADTLVTITRVWKKTKKGIEYLESTVPEMPLADYVADILGNLELPIFNMQEFLSMSANKLKDWFIGFLPAQEELLSWEKLLSEEITDIGQVLDAEILPDTLAYIQTLPNSNSVSALREINKYLKEQQSAVKTEHKMLENTIQGLIYYDDCESSNSTILRDELVRLEAEQERNQRMLANFTSNKRFTDALNQLQYGKRAKTYTEDPTYVDAQVRLSESKAELDKILSDISEVQHEIDEISKDAAYKQNIINGKGICPYSQTVCDAISKNIPVISSELESDSSRISILRTVCKDLKGRQDAYSAIVSELEALCKHIQQDYERKQQLEASMLKVEGSEHELSERNQYIQSRKQIIQQNLEKIAKNEAYEQLAEKLTADKYRIEQNIEIYKAWIKLTDVNGLQSQLMNKPFEKLSTHITSYIRSFFGNPTIYNSFILEDTANSFSFGIRKLNSYVPYEQLSSGEKCIYILSMLLSLIELSESKLPLILLDDMLDHLDDSRISECFNVLYNTEGVQMLLAGVKLPDHNNSDSFIRYIGGQE